MEIIQHKSKRIIAIAILVVMLTSMTMPVLAANVAKGDKFEFTATSYYKYKTLEAAKNGDKSQACKKDGKTDYIKNGDIITVQEVSGNILKIGNNAYIKFNANYFKKIEGNNTQEKSEAKKTNTSTSGGNTNGGIGGLLTGITSAISSTDITGFLGEIWKVIQEVFNVIMGILEGVFVKNQPTEAPAEKEEPINDKEVEQEEKEVKPEEKEVKQEEKEVKQEEKEVKPEEKEVEPNVPTGNKTNSRKFKFTYYTSEECNLGENTAFGMRQKNQRF